MSRKRTGSQTPDQAEREIRRVGVAKTLVGLKERTHCIRREARQLLQDYRAERRGAKTKRENEAVAPEPVSKGPEPTVDSREKFQRLIAVYEQKVSGNPDALPPVVAETAPSVPAVIPEEPKALMSLEPVTPEVTEPLPETVPASVPDPVPEPLARDREEADAAPVTTGSLDLSKIKIPDVPDPVHAEGQTPPEPSAEPSPPVQQPRAEAAVPSRTTPATKTLISARWEQIQKQRDDVRRMVKVANEQNAKNSVELKNRAELRRHSARPVTVSKAIAEKPGRNDVSGRRSLRRPRRDIKTPDSQSALNAGHSVSLEINKQPAPGAVTRSVPADAGEGVALEQLSQIGAGMRLRLEQIGITSVESLACADPDLIKSKLGAVSRLANVDAWIAQAKEFLDGGSPHISCSASGPR